MTAIRRSIVISAAGAFALLAACFPASVSAAHELASFAPAVVVQAGDADASKPSMADDAHSGDAGTETAAVDEASLKCMAKVVHHESRGQPRLGQIAVAQTLINRLKRGNGRFGDSICAVANQHGQFFDTNAYHPREDSGDWKTALDVSRDALNGSAEPAPGALFFRAAYASGSSFFRSRQHVATIGGQVFYR